MKSKCLTPADVIKFFQLVDPRTPGGQLTSLSPDLIDAVLLALEKDVSALPPVLQECARCHRLLPQTLSYFDEDLRLKSGLTKKCHDCRRSYLRRYYRGKRTESRLRRQNPGYDSDMAEIARARAQYRSEQPVDPSVEGPSEYEPPTRPVGRPSSSSYVMTRTEAEAIVAAGRGL